MRKILLLCMMLTLTIVQSNGQIGTSSVSISLEDNNFIGIVWEPEGYVYYFEKDGQEYYGLLMIIKTSGDFLGVDKGNKVSIEFTDGTRQVVEVVHSYTDYENHVNYDKTITGIYKRKIQILPDFEQLKTKPIKRFVIQRNNGNVWIINTAERRSKKILKELPSAMSSAVSSYRRKVQNDNYFND